MTPINHDSLRHTSPCFQYQNTHLASFSQQFKIIARDNISRDFIGNSKTAIHHGRGISPPNLKTLTDIDERDAHKS